MDDIWEEPAVVSHHKTPAQNSLFLESDDENPVRPPAASARGQRRQEPVEEDQDDFVAGLFDDIAPVDKTQPHTNRTSARPQQTQSATGASDIKKGTRENRAGPEKGEDASKPDDEPKQKSRTIAKVDEERLLGDRGFPALIKEAQQFKPKGKGHETADLDRLLSIYQFWAHNMFPKTQFRDTVDRVERVCRSRRMLINMSMWRDANRTSNHTGRDSNKSDTDEETDKQKETSGQSRIAPAPTMSVTTSNMNGPQSHQTVDEDLWDDLDDAIEQAQEQERRGETLPIASKEGPQSIPDDDDLEEWFNTGPTISNTKFIAHPKPPDDMEIDDTPPQRRMLSPPTADNWDDDLFA